MPLKWIYPEVAFRHKGVTIFHTYKDDDADNVSDNWYTTEQSNPEAGMFDIRDLKRSLKGELHTNCSRDDVLRAGIDAHILKSPEGVDHYSKYILVQYTYRCGEYEFRAKPAILDMHPDADVEDIIHDHFEEFWGEDTYQEDEGSNTYFCPTGEVALTVHSYQEISLNDVEVMERHGANVWGRRTFNSVSGEHSDR